MRIKHCATCTCDRGPQRALPAPRERESSSRRERAAHLALAPLVGKWVRVAIPESGYTIEGVLVVVHRLEDGTRCDPPIYEVTDYSKPQAGLWGPRTGPQFKEGRTWIVNKRDVEVLPDPPKRRVPKPKLRVLVTTCLTLIATSGCHDDECCARASVHQVQECCTYVPLQVGNTVVPLCTYWCDRPQVFCDEYRQERGASGDLCPGAFIDAGPEDGGPR